MIASITIENFRGVEKAQEIALAPITVLYGPTSSGKSTVFYAAMALRNFVLDPNRQADAYLNLGFMDLGGFDACVFNHEVGRSISISAKHGNVGVLGSYGLTFGKTEGTIALVAAGIRMTGKITIPYAINQSFPFSHEEKGQEYTINWNGIVSTVSPKTPTAETQQRAKELAMALNLPAEAMKAIDIVPPKRGFFKSSYTPASISPTPTTEDEIASIIINDPHMASRISQYTEEIFDRDFRLHIAPGTSTVFLQATDKKARIPVNLVNEGFGINQVVYIFAKLHRPEVNTLLIEEPEAHIHPTALRKFARALCRFVTEEHKQIVFTTHSEAFVTAMLTLVSEGGLPASDLKCYLAAKVGRTTSFDEQSVTADGQVAGGLSTFVEGEVADITNFLAARKSTHT